MTNVNSRRAACTIISKNYIALARTLAQSYRQHHPEDPFFVLLADRVDGYFERDAEPYRLVEIADLEIPEFARFSFQYTVIELNTAAKPYFLRYLLQRHGLERLIYFDPDILILRGLERLWGLLEEHSFVLTPHLTSPYEDELKPGESDLLRAGMFNLGFLGLADCAAVRRMLDWWARRLYDGCVLAPDRWRHVDQLWMNFIPGFYDGVHILRAPEYNVAYWNLNDRILTQAGRDLLVNGRPCAFFHFSGFDPLDPSRLSRHQTRFSIQDLGQAGADLVRRYSELVIQNGHLQSRSWPYAFGVFDNGVPIPDVARAIYRSLAGEARRFGDPFQVNGPDSFFRWMQGGVEGRDLKLGVPRLWYEIYHQRPDLKASFPDVLGRDRAAFLAWIVESGAEDSGVDPSLVPARELVAAERARSRRPLSARVYTKIVRPLEPRLKPWLKQSLGRRPRLWNLLKSYHRRLQQGSAVAHVPPESPEPGSAWRRARRREKLGVNIAGYFSSPTGLGEAGRASLRALRAAGIPHVVNKVADEGPESPEKAAERFSEANPYGVNLLHVNADQLPIFAAQKGAAYFANRLNVGFWFWELSDFPEEWRPSFSYLDEVWVASNFVLDAVARIAPVPVVKMPLALAPDAAVAPFDRASLGLPEDGFLFLFLFDFRSRIERKNPGAVIDAFKLAFGDRKDVALVLKSAHASGPERASLSAALGDAPSNVHWIDRIMGREEVNSLMALCDCYVSLHRSEGFGLPIAEAMALGKPVIVTAYSGNMDFTTPSNSFLVRYTLSEIQHDDGPYRSGGVWAEPDVEHAAEWMRHVAHHRAAAAAVGERARRDVRQWYDARAAGAQITRRLELIQAGF